MGESAATGSPEDLIEAAKHQKRILVVDDDPDIVMLIKYELESEGYQIVTAHDGLDAFEKIVAFRPDLIVLDILMPKVDGWVVCHSVKSNKETKDIRIIILTALTQLRSKIKGEYILQADLYRTKPFDLDELSANVAKLLNIGENAESRQSA